MNRIGITLVWHLELGTLVVTRELFEFGLPVKQSSAVATTLGYDLGMLPQVVARKM